MRSFIEYAPAAVSVNQLHHFLQLIRTGEFRQFDYNDEWKNIAVYGRRVPPAYDLTKVTAPTFFHHSQADSFVKDPDIFNMSSQLSHYLGTRIVPSADFGHLDYILSTFVRELLNEHVIGVMKAIDTMDKMKPSASVECNRIFNWLL